MAKRIFIYVYGGGGAVLLLGLFLGYLIFPIGNNPTTATNSTSTTPTVISPNPIIVNPQNETLNDYLAKNLVAATGSGKIFCSSEGLGSGKIGNQDVGYLWALCAEYEVMNGAIVAGPALDTPVALALKDVNGSYSIIGYNIPRRGQFYANDLANIFPADIRTNQLFEQNSDYHRVHIQTLADQNGQKAHLYFKL